MPFAQLLPQARAAFGRNGAWLPRIETTHSLARALGPAVTAQPLQASLDRGADVLVAAQLLESQAEGRAWARRDPAGFDAVAGLVADTTAELLRASAAVVPSRRAAHWQRARSLLAPAAGPGGTERWLARIALEWAAEGVEPPTDRLFALRPAAWIALQLGGSDELALALLREADGTIPCLQVDADPPPERLLADAIPEPLPSFALCESFEDEAQAAAATVIQHAAAGRVPVALVALDRVLVRRIRALLEGAGLAVGDETGWRLSTTRAAARLMALLDAADPEAGTDTLFDWLKGIETWPGETRIADRVASLEAACRRHGIARIASLVSLTDEPFHGEFCGRVLALLRSFDSPVAQPVAGWLDRLNDALAECGLLTGLQTDDAGRQLLAALRLDETPEQRAQWLRTAGSRRLDLRGLRGWIDGVLERATFRPPAPPTGAQVVITPLAQAIWRPFAALVMPGASDRQLGGPPGLHPLLGTALLAPLGLPEPEAQRHREAAAFAHALRIAPATLLRRHLDGPEPLADSPLVERLRLELAQRDLAFAPWRDPRPFVDVALDPQPLPAPSAAALLPTRLSASAAEALRDCPYRFFALHVLKLREADELGAEVEKRDYGNWLHDVLRDFHNGRHMPATLADDEARLHAIGEAQRNTLDLDEAEFLPFAASFAAFVPRYLRWLHAREASGIHWRAAEQEAERPLPGVAGTTLYGRIDRIDRRERPSPGGDELIDYKTGSADKLRDKARRGDEDTQLAFYAALLQPQADAPLHAMYLALDGSRDIVAIEHEDVDASAHGLLDSLAHDLRRLQAGAPMRALGSGPSCEFCAARGLCRRDHWGDAETLPADEGEGAS